MIDRREIDPELFPFEPVRFVDARDGGVPVGGVRPRDNPPPGSQIRTLTRRRLARDRLEFAAWSRARGDARGFENCFTSLHSL